MPHWGISLTAEQLGHGFITYVFNLIRANPGGRMEKPAGHLLTVLERYRALWDPKKLAELARQLREFADSLDSQKGGNKTKHY